MSSSIKCQNGTYAKYYLSDAIKQTKLPERVALSYAVSLLYAKSSTSEASEALMYDAASEIFFAAYLTKIFVGLR